MRKLIGYLLIPAVISVPPVISTPATAARPGAMYCGELAGASYGPFDYVNRHRLKAELNIVEIAHFTYDVENLIRGNSSEHIGGDLNYTLHAWPNHHRALVSLARLSIREKSTRLPGFKYPVECYFDRAIRMNATDTRVRSIYGGYLLQRGRNKEAIEQLEIAVNLEPDNATALYNLGLLYLKQKKYEKANEYAQKAYKLDFPLPGLKNKLISAGKWKMLPRSTSEAE
ncbi:MAG: tetratricopeptide repeat protein [Nitrosomonas sp.]|nr:tetratricopeptide repeat protein [Nitrosomonas sp.]